MKALLLTNEYPPTIYGGAGVHVEYLSRELARLMEVEVRCFGNQNFISGIATIHVCIDPMLKESSHITKIMIFCYN